MIFIVDYLTLCLCAMFQRSLFYSTNAIHIQYSIVVVATEILTTMAAAVAVAATTAITLIYVDKNAVFRLCPTTHLFQAEQIKFISINDDTLW